MFVASIHVRTLSRVFDDKHKVLNYLQTFDAGNWKLLSVTIKCLKNPIILPELECGRYMPLYKCRVYNPYLKADKTKWRPRKSGQTILSYLLTHWITKQSHKSSKTSLYTIKIHHKISFVCLAALHFKRIV